MPRKKPAAKAAAPAVPATVVTNEAAPVHNGLSGAILGSMGIGGGVTPWGFPGSQGAPWSEQISQVNTLFKNLRWYLVSNDRQLLNEMYCELGLIQAIVNTPVDDALRGGIEVNTKQLDEHQILELLTSMDRDDNIGTAGLGAKWNRLFGGAGILILTDQDPATPLRLSSLHPGDPLEFRACDMWELFWDKQNSEGYDPAIQSENFDFYNYYGEQVHKSRVMRLKGLTAPSFIRPRLRGWGLSVVEILVRSINQYLKSTDLSFEVLDEFKVDVYKMKNLANTLMSPQGEQQVTQRLQLANFQKNYQNALIMDSEDDWDHKQLSFSGLAEAMEGIRLQIASDMRMPLTKIFGQSAAGFNSGEDDIEVYNAMVEGEVRNKIKYTIHRMVEIKCQQMFGVVPDDLKINFKPLRVLTAVDEENVKTAKFTRLVQAFQAGLISDQEFRDGINKNELLDVRLDTQEDFEDTGYHDDETGDDDMVDQDNPKDKDDPGANRADTRKARSALVDGGRGRPSARKPSPRSSDAPEVKARALNRRNHVTPWSAVDRMDRILKNSPAFDRASYEADGGDSWIDPRRRELFSNPGNVDEGLWERAKEASQAALGEVRWQFVTWWYRKQGGKFQ